jgi:hypothetical protein
MGPGLDMSSCARGNSPQQDRAFGRSLSDKAGASGRREGLTQWYPTPIKYYVVREPTRRMHIAKPESRLIQTWRSPMKEC